MAKSPVSLYYIITNGVHGATMVIETGFSWFYPILELTITFSVKYIYYFCGYLKYGI